MKFGAYIDPSRINYFTLSFYGTRTRTEEPENFWKLKKIKGKKWVYVSTSKIICTAKKMCTYVHNMSIVKPWLDLVYCPLNHAKYFLKILSITILISLCSFMATWFIILKMYSKMYCTVFVTTHHGIKFFKIDEMDWNKNMSFLRAKQVFSRKWKNS